MRGSIFSSLSLTRRSQAPYPEPRPERECPWCLCLRVEYDLLSKTNLSGSEERTNTTMVFPTPSYENKNKLTIVLLAGLLFHQSAMLPHCAERRWHCAPCDCKDEAS
jgi:hypothetical protein